MTLMTSIRAGLAYPIEIAVLAPKVINALIAVFDVRCGETNGIIIPFQVDIAPQVNFSSRSHV